MHSSFGSQASPEPVRRRTRLPPSCRRCPGSPRQEHRCTARSGRRRRPSPCDRRTRLPPSCRRCPGSPRQEHRCTARSGRRRHRARATDERVSCRRCRAVLARNTGAQLVRVAGIAEPVRQTNALPPSCRRCPGSPRQEHRCTARSGRRRHPSPCDRRTRLPPSCRRCPGSPRQEHRCTARSGRRRHRSPCDRRTRLPPSCRRCPGTSRSRQCRSPGDRRHRRSRADTRCSGGTGSDLAEAIARIALASRHMRCPCIRCCLRRQRFPLLENVQVTVSPDWRLIALTGLPSLQVALVRVQPVGQVDLGD